MKRQIRSCVFETNSSSMHSLVIKKSGGYYTYEEACEYIYIHDGVWNIRNEDHLTFGRSPFGYLNTFESKVRYAIASLCCHRKDAEKLFKKIESIVCEIIPDCHKIELPTKWHNDDPCYGWVDDDILSPFLKNKNISVKEFLTNKKYVVIVDGDEYCIWEDLKDSGLVNIDEIEEEFR